MRNSFCLLARGALAAAVAFSGTTLFGESVSVAQFGAKPDGTTLNTKQIQAAIDACSQSGGGFVKIPAGVYKSGRLRIKSNVVLKLDSDAVLLGDENPDSYSPDTASGKPRSARAFIWAHNAENIGIEGGTIRGAGEKFTRDTKNPQFKLRPKNILFESCKNVSLKNVKMRSPASWNAHFLRCDGVLLTGLDIFVHANYNNDGLDIESKNVVIRDCIIDSLDDAVCLKNEHGDQNFTVENVSVENCVVASACNFIKIGTGSRGDFKNIKVSNCVLKRPPAETLLRWGHLKNAGIESDAITGISGIALEAVDGGGIDGVSISNIAMTGIQTPIFIRVDNRDTKTFLKKKSSITNVEISNITARAESYITSTITAVKGYALKNVKIRDCAFLLKGCDTENADGATVPEPKKRYPENRMFGVLIPSYAFYIRNAENLTLSNIVADYTGAEKRPAVYAENAENLHIADSVFKKPDNRDTFRFVNTATKITNCLY